MDPVSAALPPKIGRFFVATLLRKEHMAGWIQMVFSGFLTTLLTTLDTGLSRKVYSKLDLLNLELSCRQEEETLNLDLKFILLMGPHKVDYHQLGK